MILRVKILGIDRKKQLVLGMQLALAFSTGYVRTKSDVFYFR